MRSLFLVVATMAAVAFGQTAEQDRVDLGSFYVGPSLSFNFFAGYLSVGNAKFYYWFAESQRSPKNDPLVAFYNGGPGCSSVSGSLTENGPFQPNSDGSGLVPRDISWNAIANMLWIESPAGVGYSYIPGTPVNATYATDDHQTARNNLLALEMWFARFPQYRQHDFYISGESYAGTYIPTLTVQLLQSQSGINLKGLAIGNPCSDEIIDHNAFFSLVSTHDIIDATLAATIEAECPANFRYIPSNTCCQFNYSAYPAQSEACVAALNSMYTLFANNNLYDLYSECSGGPNGNSPCVADPPLNQLMNNDAFRSVIHAAPSSQIGSWYDCTPNLNYTSNYASMVTQVWPVIFSLNSNLRVMIYSGDADACVPFFGTRAWTQSIGGAVEEAWHPWQYTDPQNPQNGPQLAGYTVRYERLRFTSLKGIGHMAPEFGPLQAFQMFQNFLADSFPNAPTLKIPGIRPKWKRALAE